MFCWNCGKQIADDSLFCTECGARQVDDTQSMPEQPLNNEQPEYNGQQVYNEQPVYSEQPVYNEQQNYQEQMYQPGGKNCMNCGSYIAADAMFCPVCNAQQYANMNNGMNNPIQQKKKVSGKKIGIIIGGVAAALVVMIIAGILLLRFMKPTINLNDYVSVSFEGYNTIGEAVVDFDYEAFSDKYGKKIYNAYFNDSSLWGREKISESDYIDACEMFINAYIDYSIDKEYDLSNDEKITLTWSCDEENAGEVWKGKLKYSDISYTVSGLTEVGTFDPFEGLNVTFGGVSPYGYVEIDSAGVCDEAQDFDFISDSYEDLQIGDTVTVYISLGDEDIVDYCTYNYGKIPSVTEKEYVVDGLDSYVTSVDQISADCLTEMQSQANDVYSAYIANNWSDDQQLKNFLYLGSYLLTSKSDADNILYLVYKSQVHNKYVSEYGRYNKVDEVYWYISFEDILVSADGQNIIDVTEYDIPYDGFYVDTGVSDGWWDSKKWYYTGYDSLQSMYNTIVTAHVDEYNHEDRIDENLVNSTITVPDDEEVADDNDEKSEDGIIFPQSSKKKISSKQIKGLTDEELQSAINEIYARKGYRFKDDDIRAFYEQFDWYEPMYGSDEFTMNMFNKVEKANVQNMQKERDKRKR